MLLRQSGSAGVIAELRVDGELIRSIDLSAVAAPYEFEVDCGSGSNTVRAEHGAISIVRADCPDQVCVRQGTIEDSALPIVCLPHKLVITIVGEP